MYKAESASRSPQGCPWMGRSQLTRSQPLALKKLNTAGDRWGGSKVWMFRYMAKSNLQNRRKCGTYLKGESLTALMWANPSGQTGTRDRPWLPLPLLSGSSHSQGAIVSVLLIRFLLRCPAAVPQHHAADTPALHPEFCLLLLLPDLTYV